MALLAALGGQKIRTKPYPWHITTDQTDIKAALRVLKSGVLSVFEGANTPYFLGGKEVQSLEKEWAAAFDVRHAVAVNSATSGLMAAVGALGISPGDEVIVPPWTMTATAAAILAYGALPVFCDIREDTYTLDPEAAARAVTPRTRAIMVVHLFGHPADMDPLLRLARKHHLGIIEDVAQSPQALYKGRPTGTIGDIGVFSLNSNKIIQCGEGGVAVTNNKELALRLQLIRNHAEAAIDTGIRVKSLVNMLGWNYRMNEVEAAISRVQLTKLKGLLRDRLLLVNHLTNRLKGLPGLILPIVREGCTHSYYRFALRLDPRVIPVNGPTFAAALNAEGLDFYPGYKPLYLQPLYQKRLVFGSEGYPFQQGDVPSSVSYATGICPVAERLWSQVISTEVVRPPLRRKDMAEIAKAIEKVISYPKELIRFAAHQRGRQ